MSVPYGEWGLLFEALEPGSKVGRPPVLGAYTPTRRAV